MPCDEYGRVFRDPSADDSVIRQDEERYDGRDITQPVPFFSSEDAVGGQRTLLGLTADTDLTHQQCITEGDDQDQIDDEKKTSAVFGGQIWESPEVPQTDGGPDGGHQEIIDIYNAHNPLARGYAVQYTDSWCAAFVSAVAIKCGYTSIIPTECGCPEMIEKFKLLGEWVEDDKYNPKPGDVIFFDWEDTGIGDDVGTADHVGFVEAVSHGIITTIEGNKADSVSRRKIAVGARYIRGYGVPRYTEKIKHPEPAPAGISINTTPQWVGEVTAQMLNVRTWAGMEYKNIKSYPTLAKTNLVDVCDTVKAADGSDWYYIRIAGKWYGFVSAKYIVRK